MFILRLKPEKNKSGQLNEGRSKNATILINGLMSFSVCFCEFLKGTGQLLDLFFIKWLIAERIALPAEYIPL